MSAYLTPFDGALLVLEAAYRISIPLLLGTIIAGLAIGILQAIFQIQEASAGLVARIAGLVAACALLGHELLLSMIEITELLFRNVGR